MIMKERILLAPFVSGTELMRTLARFGKPSFCLRIMGETELAETALMKCGKAADRGLVSSGKAESILYGIIKQVPYYANASFSDAVNLLNTLTELRGLIAADESGTMRDRLSDGEFPEADAALFEVYEKYMSALDAEGLYDTVGYLRYALENAAPADAEIMLLEEYPASELGKALADKLAGGKAETVTLAGLFGVGEKPLGECRVVRSYGSMNEARDILDEIVSGEIPYDKCTVACAETSALPLMLRELSEEYGIPMTFGCGLPIGSAAPARLLSYINDWLTDGKCGIDGLDSVVFADEFDTEKLCETLSCKRKELHGAVETAGNLRLSLEPDENAAKIKALKKVLDKDSEKYASLSLAEKLFAEFENGIAYIIGTYAAVRPSCKALDKAAISAVCGDLGACTDTDECLAMLPCTLSRRICPELSREGCLHITGIGKAACSLRENMFIAGLTASAFPGAPKENYLICDKDILRFGESAHTSERIVTEKREAFTRLLSLASAAGCSVRLSFSGFDTAELKENNASSVVFEVLRGQVGNTVKLGELESHIETKGYFNTSFSAADKAAEAYSEGRTLTAADPEEPVVPERSNKELCFYPSAFGTYFECQKKFYYSSVLGLGTPDSDDPMQVIAANTLGSLFHDELMETYGRARQKDPEYSVSEEDFIKEANRVWDRFILSRPPFNKNEELRQRSEFANMALNALRMERQNKVLKVEEPLKFTHSSGYKIKGRLDRVEKLPNGALTVADFKTGKSNGYKDDDFASCIQVMLYAYILEKQGITVGRGEYRFVKGSARTVTCGYTKEMRARVEALLDEIADRLQNGGYTAAKKKDSCTYCDYKELCSKEAAK